MGALEDEVTLLVFLFLAFLHRRIDLPVLVHLKRRHFHCTDCMVLCVQ